jgi:hypothetical protein
MKSIPLTQGKNAIVDDEDYEFINKWKWHAYKGYGGVFYAHRSLHIGKRVKHIFMHRVINETPEGLDTDHVNGDGLDNRRENIRTATRSQNMFNRAKNKNNTSGYRGVSWHAKTQKWQVQVRVNNKNKYIGLFRSLEDAANAYKERSKELIGHEIRREH